MSPDGLIGLWADSLSLSIFIWLVVLIPLAYLAREQAERVIRAFTRMLSSLLRHAGRGVGRRAQRLQRWRRDYLRGVEARRLEGRFEQEYQAIHARVNRDLGGYPALQRRINEQISQLERDYHTAQDQVPEEPSWVRTANALAAAPPKGDPRVSQVLEEMHDSLARSARDALEEYRRSSRDRIEALRGLLPAWRELSDQLGQLDRSVRGVRDHARRIDEMVMRFQHLQQGRVPSRSLTLASTGVLAFSSFLLGLLALCGVVLFHLLERPMWEVLGGLPQGDGVGLSQLAVALLIFMAVFAGAMMSETRQVTRMIPAFGGVEPRVRRRFYLAGMVVLVTVAVLSGSLAASRGLYMAQEDALGLLLQGEPDMLLPALDWLSTLTLLLLGLLLTFVLSLGAVPVQMFMQALGVVTGTLAVFLLEILSALLLWVSWGLTLLGRLLLALYELWIFIPVWIERAVQRARDSRSAPEKPLVVITPPSDSPPAAPRAEEGPPEGGRGA